MAQDGLLLLGQQAQPGSWLLLLLVVREAVVWDHLHYGGGWRGCRPGVVIGKGSTLRLDRRERKCLGGRLHVHAGLRVQCV